MGNLKYTTLLDIKTFLKTLDYYWLGKVYNEENEKTATISDIKGIITLKVYKEHPSKNNAEKLNIFVSDRSFDIIDYKHNTIQDHSVRWQAFMLERKDKDYAKYVYDKCLEEQKEKEEQYNKKINLIKKKEQNLRYQKSLEIAKYNTTLVNATCKLYDFEIREIDTLFSRKLDILSK